MSDKRNLIERARKLAMLANAATPGPWELRQYGIYSTACRRYVLEPSGGPRALQTVLAENDADYELVLAAQDMAALLRQLADALEDRIADEEVA